MSSLVVESHWNLDNCVGVPANIYLFNVVDIYAYETTQYNETWPEFYQMAVYSTPLDWCGLIQDGVKPNECCRNSLDLTQSVYQSSIFGYLEEYRVEDFVTKSSIAASYCHFKALSNDSLSGYSEIYINDQTCANHISCNGSEFQVYESSDCSGDIVEKYSIDKLETQIYSFTLGDILYRKYQLDVGAAKVKWVSYLPGGNLVPDLKTFSGITEAILMGLTIFGDIVLILNSIYEFKKIRTIEKLMALMTQVLFLIYIILRMIYDFTIYDTMDAIYQMFLTNSISSICFSVGSFMLAIIPINIVIKVFGYQKWCYLIYLGLFLIHVALRGTSYLIYWYLVYDIRYVDGFYTFFETYWLPLSPIWTILVILITYFPIILLLKNVLLKTKGKVQNLRKQIKQFLKKETKMVRILYISLLNMLMYITITIVHQYYKLSLGSDRMVLLIRTLPTIHLTIHCLLILIMLNNIKIIFSRGKTTSVPKKTKEMAMNSDVAQPTANANTIRS
ncbi:hypothetical protein BC833DRAFT_601596 [Globomyces pollinis-pini]|nr:hypothetical protein BC833DRAFT_601596 [Globomyces pollinis-pini]